MTVSCCHFAPHRRSYTRDSTWIASRSHWWRDSYAERRAHRCCKGSSENSEFNQPFDFSLQDGIQQILRLGALDFKLSTHRHPFLSIDLATPPTPTVEIQAASAIHFQRLAFVDELVLIETFQYTDSLWAENCRIEGHFGSR